MKKKVTITAVVIICILLVVAVALSANRAGGEIGFEATINSVENGVAYATINKQDAGFLAPKLPGNIEFNTSDLDVKLQAGDEISGCYLSGTINGSSVRVVDVTIKGNGNTITASDEYVTGLHGQTNLFKIEADNVTIDNVVLKTTSWSLDERTNASKKNVVCRDTGNTEMYTF